MLVSLTVGKVDAGVAVLLTEDKRLIEFPSILLPPSITSGSIVDITVAQNHTAEEKSHAAFTSLQETILQKYGLASPEAPELRIRGNPTQTSLVLEWDAVVLATSTLKSLSLYRNGSKAGSIPRPMDMLSTKISGLAVDTEYTFHLVLRTSGGTYSSNELQIRTHKMTDLTGIVVTPGIMPPPLRDALETAVERIGGRMVDSVRIDTTHFVCTEGRGKDWERAREMNIPVARPEFVEGCEREGRIVPVRGYYLDANPKDRQVGSSIGGTTATPSRASSSATAVPGTSQTTLPQRGTPKESVPDTPKESIPDTPKESIPETPVSGEPGPEVPPTPPPKGEAAEPEEMSEKQGREEEPVSPLEEEEEDEEEEEEEPPRLAPSDEQEEEEEGGNEKMEEVEL